MLSFHVDRLFLARILYYEFGSASANTFESHQLGFDVYVPFKILELLVQAVTAELGQSRGF